MSNAGGYNATNQNAVYPLAPLPAEALQGVRSRRIVAIMLDLILVTLMSFGLWLILGFATLGLLWFILPPLFPFVAFFYNGLTISGWRRATPGMKAMDLEMRLIDGATTPFLNAAIHAVLFYVSTLFPPVFLFSLIERDKRCLHDIFAGVIILRRA